MNIEKYIDQRKLDELKNYTNELKYEKKVNPDYWNNNKRKMHGLPLRRKGGPKKKNFYHTLKLRQQMFQLLEEIIDETLPKVICDSYGSFVDIKDFGEGDRVPIWNSTNMTTIKMKSKRIYPWTR